MTKKWQRKGEVTTFGELKIGKIFRPLSGKSDHDGRMVFQKIRETGFTAIRCTNGTEDGMVYQFSPNEKVVPIIYL